MIISNENTGAGSENKSARTWKKSLAAGEFMLPSWLKVILFSSSWQPVSEREADGGETREGNSNLEGSGEEGAWEVRLQKKWREDREKISEQWKNDVGLKLIKDTFWITHTHSCSSILGKIFINIIRFPAPYPNHNHYKEPLNPDLNLNPILNSTFKPCFNKHKPIKHYYFWYHFENLW